MKIQFRLLALTALAASAMAASAQTQTLRIATEGAYPPFNYVDSNNQLHGFDVDIANALCERMKTRCSIVAQDWDGIIPALLTRKYDAIVASMVVTDERKAKVSFTDRYYTTRLSVAVRKGANITDTLPASMKGKTVGAQSSSTQGMFAEDVYGKAGARVKLYPTQDEANADLASGRVDAVVHDKFPLQDWLKTNGKDCCAMLGDVKGSDAPVSIAVRKDDAALRARLNKALADIIADGTYKNISARYFAFNIY